MTSSAEPGPSKPKRRWLQFSLRTLLVFVLLVAALCGWLRHKVNQSEQERRAVDAILALGGDVRYEEQMFDRRGRPIRPIHAPGPAWLRALLGDHFFADVETVFYPCGAGDESLVHLDGLRHLSELHLRGTSVTDAGLAHVTKHRELVGLDLTATSVTDAGIAQLECLPNLTWLELRHTAITDRGVESLVQFDWLEGVGLGGTLVTADGYRKMQAALGPDVFMEPWTPAPSETERRIAVALERRGASVQLFREHERPEAEYGVLLVDPWWKGDPSDLADLTRLDHFWGIYLRRVAWNDELVEALRGLSNLKNLHVSETPVTHAQWVRLTDKKSPGEAPGQSNPEGLSILETLSLRDVPITDADLGLITEWRNLRRLTLDRAPITDAGLAHLQALTKLEELDLDGAAITNVGLKHLGALTNLIALSLANTQVIDSGLAHLKGLTKLESLDLAGTRITDAALVHLEPLQNLERLDLSRTRVTNAGLAHAGLAHLEKLKKLEVLILEGIEFGPQGTANRARLEKALPEVEICR